MLIIATSALARDNLVRSHLRGGTQVQTPGDLLARVAALSAASTLPDGNVYVGSEFCLACHQKERWRTTKHAQALRRPMAEYSLIKGKGVVADYDKNGIDDFQQGLDFNQISSVFDPYKPNAPKLSFEAGTYFITIGELKMPVVFTQGGTGSWKQRFGVRIPVSDTPTKLSAEIYMSPIQYNEKTRSYVLYNDKDWYDTTTKAPKWVAGMTAAQISAHGGSYSKNCIGCHSTGIRSLKQTANGEWLYSGWPATLSWPDDPSYFDYDGDGINDLVNIGCEACHGPGGNHILGGGDVTKIVHPGKLPVNEANEVCEQCHVRVKSVPNGTHKWPFNDATHTSWIPGSGEPLANYYTDSGGYWPDGTTSKQHHQQLSDLYRSSKPTNPFHPVRCFDCHDPHGSANKNMIVESIHDDRTNLDIPTANNNNTLCLACHATHGDFSSISKEEVAAYAENVAKIAAVVSAHTHHPYGPERSMGLSRCSKCHLPTVAKSAVDYDIHSHTFEVIPPEKTLHYQDAGGMPNACAVSCHGTKVNSFGLGLDPALGTWNAQFDKDLATVLMKYYGPEGLWWKRSLMPSQLPVVVPFSTDSDD